ncbi:MAG: hypothetical protein ACJARG_000727, partial [Arcticibacterium sp.]
ALTYNILGSLAVPSVLSTLTFPSYCWVSFLSDTSIK